MGELILENVAKNFGGLKAVDRLDMTLKKGEILGLIGEAVCRWVVAAHEAGIEVKQ